MKRDETVENIEVGPKRVWRGMPRRWSLRQLDQARVQQLLVLFCSCAIIAIMILVISSMMASGQYPLGPMAMVDGLTILGLGLAIVLSLRKQAPHLQIILVCMSIPVNLLSEIMLVGTGAWVSILLIGLSPFMWGLLGSVSLTVVYTIALICFFNIYLAAHPEGSVLFLGSDQTFLTAVALSVIAVASALAAVLPRKITGAAYKSLNRSARQETVLKQRFAHYATLASDWHLEINEHGTITDFFGTGDATGKNWKSILFDWESQAEAFRQALQTRTAYTNIRATLRIGDLSRRVECHGEPIFHQTGEFAGYRVIAHDITDKAEAEERLKVLAMHDRLTGLRNRHAFNLAVEARQVREDQTGTAILCIDLDNFKHLNDRQGHTVGDTALRTLGERFLELEAAVSGMEVFRLGGDEFCALVDSEWDAGRMKEIAQQFAAAVSKPVAIEDRLLDLAASIGIAGTRSGTSLSSALERADAAVYEAKSLGGGQTIICDGDVEQRLERRLAIRRDLASAIAGGEISLHYQPIFEVRTGKLSGVEALARWTHPEYGNIPPDEFITVAEGSRAIIALGQHTLSLACRETLQWMERTGQELRLNVNVSPMEIMSDSFVSSLQGILERTGFPATLLEIEITERGMLEDIDLSRERLNTIRESGVAVSLDDFGTGHSSLSRLESLPVDRIKVDRSFFAQVGESKRIQQLLALISGISNIMGVEIVAEGIETEDQLHLVRIAGFSKAQGYLLGRPGRLENLPATQPEGVYASMRPSAK